MGSVADIYTTGDNDPEIDPVSYYRHYLYCDSCGSFALESWETSDREGVEKKQHVLAMAAWLATPLLVVPIGVLLGIFFPLEGLLFLAAVLVISPLLRRLLDWKQEENARRWRFVKWVVLAAVPLVWLVGEVTPWILPPWVVLVAGVVLVISLLMARLALERKIVYLGKRCRDCGATYANGSSFFTDLDANPRQLKVEDVPRPLGISFFVVGKSVEVAPQKPKSRLPP